MNAKDNSRTSFDRQAAAYDIDRNGSHARTVYRPVLDMDPEQFYREEAASQASC